MKHNRKKGKPEGPWRLAFQRFCKNRLAILGAVLMLAILFFIYLGPLFSPYQMNKIDIVQRFKPPNRIHWFGTDMLGQDLMLRVMHGGRLSLAMALLSATVTLSVGTLVGLVAGYRGKTVDFILMRFTEFISVLPLLPFLIAFSVIFGFQFPPTIRLTATMIIFGFLNFPTVAKVVRGQILTLREEEFMQAANILGLSHGSKLFRHLLPNVFGLVIAAASGVLANAILLELTLSFVDLGFPPPTPSWGNLIPNIRGANHVSGADYWIWLYPISFISLTIISMNLLGEGLREALDPKTYK